MALTPLSVLQNLPTPAIREGLIKMRNDIIAKKRWEALKICRWNREEAERILRLWIIQEEAEYWEWSKRLDAQSMRYKYWQRSRRRRPYCRA